MFLQTSGTTSTPKVVPYSFKNLVFNTRQMIRSLKLKDNDVCLNVGFFVLAEKNDEQLKNVGPHSSMPEQLLARVLQKRPLRFSKKTCGG